MSSVSGAADRIANDEEVAQGEEADSCSDRGLKWQNVKQAGANPDCEDNGGHEVYAGVRGGADGGGTGLEDADRETGKIGVPQMTGGESHRMTLS